MIEYDVQFIHEMFPTQRGASSVSASPDGAIKPPPSIGLCIYPQIVERDLDSLMSTSAWLLWCIREVYYVFLEPIFVFLGVAKFGFGDATYGRDALPYSASERRDIYENPDVTVTRRRVYMSRNEPILSMKLRDVDRALPFTFGGKKVTAFINYYVWEMPHISQREHRTCPQNATHMQSMLTCTWSMASMSTQAGVHLRP